MRWPLVPYFAFIFSLCFWLGSPIWLCSNNGRQSSMTFRANWCKTCPIMCSRVLFFSVVLVKQLFFAIFLNKTSLRQHYYKLYKQFWLKHRLGHINLSIFDSIHINIWSHHGTLILYRHVPLIRLLHYCCVAVVTKVQESLLKIYKRKEQQNRECSV